MRRIKKLLLGRLRHKYKTVICNYKVRFKLAAMKIVAVKGDKDGPGNNCNVHRKRVRRVKPRLKFNLSRRYSSCPIPDLPVHRAYESVL